MMPARDGQHKSKQGCANTADGSATVVVRCMRCAGVQQACPASWSHAVMQAKCGCVLLSTQPASQASCHHPTPTTMAPRSGQQRRLGHVFVGGSSTTTSRGLGHSCTCMWERDTQITIIKKCSSVQQGACMVHDMVSWALMRSCDPHALYRSSTVYCILRSCSNTDIDVAVLCCSLVGWWLQPIPNCTSLTLAPCGRRRRCCLRRRCCWLGPHHLDGEGRWCSR